MYSKKKLDHSLKMESAVCFEQESCWISDLIKIKLIMGKITTMTMVMIAMVVMIMMTIVISIFDKFFLLCPTQIEAISSRVAAMFLTHRNWSIIEISTKT